MVIFSSGFSLLSSHHNLPPAVPHCHLLHPGPDQQEVTEYSDQPSLPGSPPNLHLLLLLQTEDIWRQKNCILSQAEYRKYGTQWSLSWNHLFYLRHNAARLFCFLIFYKPCTVLYPLFPLFRRQRPQRLRATVSGHPERFSVTG